MTMKANLRAGNLTFQIEGANQKDMFKQIAACQEVFSEECCGLCQGTDLRYVVREVDGNDFPELHCLNPQCRAKLAFGQSKQKPGVLFPIRKLVESGPEAGKPHRKTGNLGKHNGWTKYRGKEGGAED